MLKECLKYEGPPWDLRSAKEQLSSERTDEVELDNGHIISRQDVDDVLTKGEFIPKTLMAALDTYKRAKLLWNRTEGSPPYGEIISGGTVWSLQIEDMARDIDRVLVIGGPTLMPYFPGKLRQVFGDEKIVSN